MILCALASLALAGPVKVTAWTASSTAANTDTAAYDASKLGDGKQSTAWVEGDDGAGLGSWVLFEFGENRSVSQVQVWAGNWYNTEYWGHYNRPKNIVFEFADGSTEEHTLADEQAPQLITLKSAKSTSTVKLRVKGIYSGKGVDTAIAEVKFFDGGATVSSATASTTAPADTDGNYNAGNMVDGISDSMWCEGNKKSDGTGEWVELRLAKTASVTGLKVRNGAGFSTELFKQVNRAATAKVSFSDGSSEEIALKDLPMELPLSFAAPHTTSSIKLSFTSAKKGTDYDDLCVSEITVVP